MPRFSGRLLRGVGRFVFQRKVGDLTFNVKMSPPPSPSTRCHAAGGSAVPMIRALLDERQAAARATGPVRWLS
jgi:hypothetical protein